MCETNRRDFVKIGAGAAAVAALPGILRAQKAPAQAAGAYYRANETVRVACVGGAASPGIGETLALLGRDHVLARIDRALPLAQ